MDKHVHVDIQTYILPYIHVSRQTVYWKKARNVATSFWFLLVTWLSRKMLKYHMRSKYDLRRKQKNKMNRQCASLLSWTSWVVLCSVGGIWWEWGCFTLLFCFCFFFFALFEICCSDISYYEYDALCRCAVTATATATTSAGGAVHACSPLVEDMQVHVWRQKPLLTNMKDVENAIWRKICFDF